MRFFSSIILIYLGWNSTLEKNSCSAIIGNGIEEHRDSSEPMSAGLAAPRGMCTGIMHDQPVLFIADSNSSSIRVVTLANGNVTNLIGGDADPKVQLFETKIPIALSFSLCLEFISIW